MELRQLRYFVSIVDFGSFSKASAQLNIAQPALSQQMAHLEAELRTTLLVRSGRGATPTEAGTRLYRQARAILRQVEQLRDDARESGSAVLTGAVSVGLPTSASTALTLPLLRRVLERLPGIRLRLIDGLSGNLHEALLNNRIDIAVLYLDGNTKGVAVEPIMAEQLFLVSNDIETAGSDVPLAELANVRLALPGPPHAMRSFVEQSCRDHGIRLDIVAEIDSLHGLRAIAASGLAAAVLPQSALMETTVAGPLYLRPIVDPLLVRPLSICRSEGTPASPQMMAVALELAQTMRDLIKTKQWLGTSLHTPAHRRARQKFVG